MNWTITLALVAVLIAGVLAQSIVGASVDTSILFPS